MLTQEKEYKNRYKVVVEKLDFDDLNPFVGPLEPHEKQVILDARKFIHEKTPLKFPNPYFFEKTNLQGEKKEYLWIAWSHNHPDLLDDYPSQVFFRRFESYLQTLALQKWLEKNKEVTTLISKLVGDLKVIEPLQVNAHLQLSEVYELLRQANDRINNLINLLQPADKDERSEGGTPASAKRLLVCSLREQPFYFNHKDYIQLTPRQIAYVLVGMGIWLPYTDSITREAISLKDFIAYKIPSIRADIRSAKNSKRKMIQLKRIALRQVP